MHNSVYGTMQSLSYEKVNDHMIWINIHRSLRECKKIVWQRHGIAKSNNLNTACEIQNLPQEYFSVEPFEMPYHLSSGQMINMYLKGSYFALFCTQIYIKPMLLQSGSITI
jgi:hypothetical protein